MDFRAWSIAAWSKEALDADLEARPAHLNAPEEVDSNPKMSISCQRFALNFCAALTRTTVKVTIVATEANSRPKVAYRSAGAWVLSVPNRVTRNDDAHMPA